jgi:hypothetical protein
VIFKKGGFKPPFFFLVPIPELCQALLVVMSFQSWAGILAGVLSLLGFIPYVTTTLAGKNKPNRASWLIWGVLSVILLTSYKSAGATHALWLSGANVLGMGLVVGLSFKYGEGGFTPLDVSCLIAAFIGMLCWGYFHSPLPALYTSVAVDAIGAIPTVKKAYLNPAHENYPTWLLFWAANTLNLFALDDWRLALSLYPIYLFLISGIMAVVLTLRRRRQSLP